MKDNSLLIKAFVIDTMCISITNQLILVFKLSRIFFFITENFLDYKGSLKCTFNIVDTLGSVYYIAGNITVNNLCVNVK